MKFVVALLLCLIILPIGCKQGVDIYFVPVGNVSPAEMNELVVHYQQKLNLSSVILSPMTISPGDFDPSRKQLVAENILQSLQRDYSSYLKNNSAILIGITDDDMYPRGENWQFCFGWRKADIRMAVASTARMNLHYPGEPVGQTDSSTRLQKIITKDIGIMYYRKSPNNNPRSVLYSGILGIEELDKVTEDLTVPPIETPIWTGRAIAVTIFVFLGTIGIFWYGLNPKSKIIRASGKLSDPQYDATRPQIVKGIRFLIISFGVFFFFTETYPLASDLIHLSAGEKAINITGVVTDKSVPLFGLWFVHQTVRFTPDGDSYSLFFSGKPIKVGTSYDLLILPRSREVLVFHESVM